MWSNKFEEPLVLEPQTSRYLAFYLIMLHGLALVSLLVLIELPVYFTLLLTASVISSFFYTFSVFIMDDIGTSVTKLTSHNDGEWLLELSNGSLDQARLLPSSYVSRWLVILRFENREGKHRRMVFLPDMFDAEQWRFLRVRLTYSDTEQLASD